MCNEKLIERLGRAFDSYELFFMKEGLRKYETRNAELFGVEIKEEEGLALRAIKDGRMVFAYTFDRGDKAIDALIDNGTALLPYMEKDDAIGFPGPYENYPEMDIFDDEGLKAEDEKKTAALIEMERAMIGYDKRITATRNCELQATEIEVKIINSQGLRVDGRKTLFALVALAVAKDADDVSWYDWVWANRLNEIDATAFGLNVARKAISFLGGEQLETGIYEGILSPQASCDMLGVLSGSFLSENLHKDKTRLKDRIGTKCFSDVVNIKDSGLKGAGSLPFDGEGVPSVETQLVMNGTFTAFLYDTYYGRRYHVPSTGNCVRPGIKEPPRCAPRGFFVEQGARNIAGEMADGIIIEELMGTHTANTVTGDFSLGAIGYLCSKGIKSPFKGVIFSGNVFDLLNNVKEVGNDLKFYGDHGSPSLYIEGLKISGK